MAIHRPRCASARTTSRFLRPDSCRHRSGLPPRDLALSDAAGALAAGAARPGNVRQRQWVERAVLVSTHDRLEVEDFAESIEPAPLESAGAALPPVGSMTMDEIERAMIVKSLRHHGGNVSRVAESLGLSRAALYRRFEKYEITV